MDRLNETQYLILTAVAALNGDGYGVAVQKKIKHHTGRDVPWATVHRTLGKFLAAGLVIDSWHGMPRRGGPGRRTARYYSITEEGKVVMTNAKTERRRVGLLRVR